MSSVTNNSVVYEGKEAIAHRRARESQEEKNLRIMAKVSDIAAWRKLGSISFGMEIPLNSEEVDWMVTAQISSSQLETLSNLPFVKGIEYGNRVYPLT